MAFGRYESDTDEQDIKDIDTKNEKPDDSVEDDIKVDEKTVYTPEQVKDMIKAASDKAAKAVTAKERGRAEKELAAIKAQYSDYEDLKGISAALSKYGYAGDSKAQRAAIEALAAEEEKKKEIETLESEAEKQGMTAEALYEIKKAKREAEKLKNEAEQAVAKVELEKKQKAEFDKQIKELEETYPGITYDKLMIDPAFARFEKTVDRRLTWKQVYEEYLEIKNKTHEEVLKQVKSNMSRSTSSGKQRGEAEEGTNGLTDDEKDIVDEHNRRNPKMKMTYKEFAERKSKRY